jgi:RNA polymerase sigma-70 factor (ECF subfamily)
VTERPLDPQSLYVPEAPKSDAGGRPSFRAIFEGHFSYVFHSLRRLGVKRNDLEDVTHDVFVVVDRHHTDYDAARPLRPWLFGICYRVAADYRRLSRHRHERLDGDEPTEPVDPRPAADDAIADLQTNELVMKALDALDVERRALIVMHDLDGFSMPEIVAELQIPLDTGYSRLRLARKDLKAAAQRLRQRRGYP